MRAHVLASDPHAAHGATPLIRVMVGAVFLAEGIQKFVYPGSRGPGRFESMGFPWPDFTAAFVGVFEVVCGAMLLVGLLTRVAAIPTLVIMMVAIVTTKIPILFGQGFGPFPVRELSTYGLFSMAHEMRTDWSMLLGSLFLVVAGSGPWSVDAVLRRRTPPVGPTTGDESGHPGS
ncbi:MAG: DoxX family protein [Gemmatimonadota bacterium]|nr:DoxX family protein [Gemmatimonadota bacterium]